MERLTYRKDDGTAVCNMLGEGVRDFLLGREESSDPLRTVRERLAAYEDTGLTPEEIARMANPWISVEERLPEFDTHRGSYVFTRHKGRYANPCG